MRLLRLDLDRYGPFTGKSLAFRPDARLHVVFGPNEAGKSCALAAVTDLLFGIERDTRYGFLHAAKDLRIGATIRDRDGRELEFRRRKNKPLLADAADTALPDDALTSFLGGVSREVFCRAFGLDAVSLRQSGDELKRTDGELGAALFSAASGLRGFADAKDALENDADAIFGKTRRQSRLFYQAFDRYDAARKLMLARETRAGALKALREKLHEKELRFDEIKERRSAIAVERARLERLARAAPVIGAIDAQEDRLRELGALPSGSEGLGAPLIEAIGKAAAATAAHDLAQASERRFKSELDGIVVDDAVLDSADAIEMLLRDSGAHQKALHDLPAVEREEVGIARSLEALSTRLHMPGVAALLAAQPDDAARARVAELAAVGKRLSLALEARAADVAREQEALAKMRRERDRRGNLGDPRPLRERLAALAGIRRLAEQTDSDAAAISAEAGALEEAAARLSPAADLDALAAAPLPSGEAILSFEKRFADLDQEFRSERQSGEMVAHDIGALTDALAELTASGAVPTAERIAALRAERDRHWSALAATLFDRPAALAGAALAEAVSRFETAKAEADRLADAAVLDAKRVASHADATRRLAGQQALAAEIDRRLAALTDNRDAVSREWTAAWARVGIAPLAPAAMAKWSVQVAALMDRRAELEKRRVKADQARGRIAAAKPALTALVSDLGLPHMPELPLEAMARRIEAEIARMAEVWEAARDSDTLLADLEARAADAEEISRKAHQAVAAWQDEFRSALPRIGLPAAASIVEAEAVLAAWKEVPVFATQRDNLQRRIGGMKRDAETFGRTVRTLVETVAPDLVDTDPQAALRTLNRRLLDARDARTRRQEAKRRWEEARASAARAGDARSAADRAVTAIADRIGVGVDTGLEETARKLAERDEIHASLRRRREELANAADGRAESVLRDALATYDPETAEAELGRLEQDDRALEREAQEVFADCKETKERLSGLEGAIDAEVAIQQRRSAEAEMVEAARDWAVLSIGAVMIGTAMTRQRMGRQEPLMMRAGELFATLTGGAFAGFGQAFDDDDVPYLVGRRREGDEVGVTDMSEGTRDQLYLALRLAYVEDFSARVEPPPFLGDDLFTSFDDRRTAHGLGALAAIGAAVQPVLFTHHRFVVDTAEKELGAAVDVIDLG